jgi:hypothetical protein
MRRRLLLATASCVAPALFLAHCSKVDQPAGERTQQQSRALVPSFTGRTAEITNTRNQFQQAETALTVAEGTDGQQIIVAAFNDHSDTGSTITYDDSTDAGTRTVHPGASLMGWRYSIDGAHSWSTAVDKLPPPSGWAVLWGDPALATAKDDKTNVVFSNLGIQTSDLPNPVTVLNDSIFRGLCIARSQDGGKTFAFSPEQPCIVADANENFDGGSLVAPSKDLVYAAALVRQNNNPNSGRIQVWASVMNAPFAPVSTIGAQLFANKVIKSHPRIAYSEKSGLVVAAQDAEGKLWMSRYLSYSSGWSQPAQVGSGLPSNGSTVDFLPDLKVRLAPQFSFDIGDPVTDAEDDAIRIVYTTMPDHHIKATRCPLEFTAANCVDVPEWKFPPDVDPPWESLDQFHPVVAYSRSADGTDAHWHTSFWSRETSILDDDEVLMMGAELSIGTTGHAWLSHILPLTGQQTPCPTTAKHFWGDYDGMVSLGEDPDGRHVFVRGFTDSTGVACVRYPFHADPMHVSSVRFGSY